MKMHEVHSAERFEANLEISLVIIILFLASSIASSIYFKFRHLLFSLTACCSTLNVILTNDVKAHQGSREGVYTFQGFSNEMDYWFDAEGEHALWYSTTGSSYDWNIGFLADLGSDIVVMYT